MPLLYQAPPNSLNENTEIIVDIANIKIIIHVFHKKLLSIIKIYNT